jgi:hypothetical protein
MSNDSEEDVMVIVVVEDLHAIDPSMHHVNAQTFDVEPKRPCHADFKSKRGAPREFDETLDLREV